MHCAQVLRSFSHVHLVTWECALQNIMSWAEVDKWLAVDSPTAKFMAAIMAKSILHDKVNIAAVLAPAQR